MALFIDPADLRANSYVGLDNANNILNDRPHTASWDNASQDPDGREYVIDDPGATLVPGATTIPLRGGKGNFGDTNRFTINGDSTEYTIVGAVAAPATSIVIAAPGLVAAPADGTPTHRLTSNEREAALIWATRVLDTQMDWFGSKTKGPEFQTLRFPRSGITDLDHYNVTQTGIPVILECSTAELAIYLIARDLASTPDTLGLGLKRAKMPGPFEIEADKLMVEKMIPDYLLNKLRYLGRLSPDVGGQGARVVSLLRA